jgi:transcription-repair coupling factor (superfamily II helicase)
MTFTAVLENIARSQIATKIGEKLTTAKSISLSGLSRLGKGLISTHLCQQQTKPLLIVTATVEEATRWALQLQSMSWRVYLYQPLDTFPYESAQIDLETAWTRIEILAELLAKPQHNLAIATTINALQPHLPSTQSFQKHSIYLNIGDSQSVKLLAESLARLGYEEVKEVKESKQWSRKGFSFEVFPINRNLPIRLSCNRGTVEKIREFDPTNPKSFTDLSSIAIAPVDLHEFVAHKATLLHYLPKNFIVAIDEPEQCQSYGDRWYEAADELYQNQHPQADTPKLHWDFTKCVTEVKKFQMLQLSERSLKPKANIFDFANTSIPIVPHQFDQIAALIREYLKSEYQVTLISAQPLRVATLLKEYDCIANFVSNPDDLQSIARIQKAGKPVILKYSGLTEMQGFVLPSCNLALLTDRELFGQQLLASPTFVHPSRMNTAKSVNPDELNVGDYVVHRKYGIGKFTRFETIEVKGEKQPHYIVEFADGKTAVAIAQENEKILSRYRSASNKPPKLSSIANTKAWDNALNKCQKEIYKLARDLLQLYVRRANLVGYAFPPDTDWQQEMEDSFPYQLTPDQVKAVQDVKQDMESDRPMDRLVCGDVGFGKTEVAVRAIFKAVCAGKQVALLAPTTILAQQHFHTLQTRFAAYPFVVDIVNRFRPAKERKQVLQEVADGKVQVIVGTHQLLSKDVEFHDLGLLVIDEEQRFGTLQKEKIKAMKGDVDLLTLSATPIPRTLYAALSGVREMSVIATPPPSRRSIQTHLSAYDASLVKTAIRHELDRGGQVFYVVPRIEGIEAIAVSLQAMLTNVRLAIAHGQMQESELEAAMVAFNNNEADILLCTTIIESGLDIPRVNTIVIEDAHKLGLAQLYQLRGRVGRAGIQAHAYLLYPPNLELTDSAKRRLDAIQEFSQLGSGYQLAMRDMEIRGLGDLLGEEQSGQADVIGFALYMDLLQEYINELRGKILPEVADTELQLPRLVAFIPDSYIEDNETKINAYLTLAKVKSKEEILKLAAVWEGLYGAMPEETQVLLKVMELKLVARKVGVFRIYASENGRDMFLDSKLTDSLWELLHAKIPIEFYYRFSFEKGRIKITSLALLTGDKQVHFLIEWLGCFLS